METRHADIAIIGSGTAAMNARRAVEKAGGAPLMIESGHYGTMCARVGCMPSKLLIAAADAAHEVASAGLFGIDVASWSIDGPAVMRRVRAERDRFVGGVVRQVESLPAEQLLRGHARFADATTLDVDGHTRVEAKTVVVATGSTPYIPPPFDAIRDHIMINDDVFELVDLPESLAVIGTGIIGLELGQALQRLGVRVAFFGRSNHLGPVTDPEVRGTVHEVLADELDLRLNTRVVDATSESGGIRLRFADDRNTEHAEVFERVLVAAGRRPNVATQCADAPIFMAGDVSGHIALLHEASDEGRIAGANARSYPAITEHERRTPLAIAFTDPQMAMVGVHYDQLNRERVEIGEVSFARQGRASVMGRARGLLRVYGDTDSCAVIGAEMFAPRAEHLAHLLGWIIQQRIPVPQVLEMPVYHPVLEEGLRTALRDLARKLKLTGACRDEDFASAAGN